MKTFNFIFTLLLYVFSISANASHFNKVLVIVFENTDYKKAIMQPYFSSLMKEGAIFTNFKAVTHPSQGNYVAMIAGSTFGIKDDKNIDLNERHIGDLLEESHRNWKIYAEGYPGNCFTDRTSGNYARKHVPFLSFTNVTKNPLRCSKVLEAKEFFTDFESIKLSDFSMFIPNLKNDGHDTGVAFGDVWLKKNFDSILHSKKFPSDLLVVITFDEGMSADNQIYTLFYGAGVLKGARSIKPYSFYSLLKTYEDELEIGSLNQNDMRASIIDDVWSN
jgi:hypothetical protein